MCRKLDSAQAVVQGADMRRKMRIRATFAPTRLSDSYLQSAYELVLPVSTRRADPRKLGPTAEDGVDVKEHTNEAEEGAS